MKKLIVVLVLLATSAWAEDDHTPPHCAKALPATICSLPLHTDLNRKERSCMLAFCGDAIADKIRLLPECEKSLLKYAGDIFDEAVRIQDANDSRNK